MYAKIYNSVDRYKNNENLLKSSILCAKFLMNDNIRDPITYKCCFSCTRDGKPLKIQRTIFSECFYFMAMSEVYIATRDELYKVIFNKSNFWNLKVKSKRTFKICRMKL